MPSLRNKPGLSVRELVLFSLLAAMTFALKKLMEGLPNIHPVGVMLVAITVVYRAKALYPLYTYVLLEGLFQGFSVSWLPYLYLWTVLWGAVMLLPARLPSRWKPLIYAVVCGLHGLAFGVLYAPVQMLVFGYSRKQILLWIAAGFSFDCIHGVSNFVLGFLLIVPLVRLLRRLEHSHPANPKK